ncbi:MAG TPA: transglutaminase-like cysteine peptidase [Stellaceae bacterium]|nr:transglutaminase-like cysteine peptidase [Stellaceae bacterium]
MSSARFPAVALATLVLFVLPAESFAARSPATEGGASALYGTGEIFSANVAQFPEWTDAMARAERELAPARRCEAGRGAAGQAGCGPPEWRDLIAEVRSLPLMAKLTRVNDAINRHPYVPTVQNWHRAMYWETPFEFLARGGQCQDYAIAKYLALREAGVPDASMRMLVLRDTALGVDHAVLVATVDGEAYLLDNLRPEIRPEARAPEYRPYYAINLSGWWLYAGGRNILVARGG